MWLFRQGALSRAPLSGWIWWLSAGASRNITPTGGNLSLTGFAPSVGGVPADTTITPTTAQLRLASRPPVVLRPGATNAIFGVAIAGTTVYGDQTAPGTTFADDLTILIHDDIRTNAVDASALVIHMGLSREPSTCRATVVPRGTFEVTKGQSLEVWQGPVGGGVNLFAGTIVQSTEHVRRTAHEVICDIAAIDYRWLMDRFQLVNATYVDRGVNTIVANILATFTDPASGFLPGYLPSSLGTIGHIAFENVPVSDAIQRLADTVDGGGLWTIAHNKSVSVFADPYEEGNAITVEDGGDWRNLTIHRDLTQAKNRVFFEGGGSTASAVAEPGDTTIAVEETGWYNPAGGTVRYLNQDITYTGVSAGSGAGSLTGVTGISRDIPQGGEIWNLAQADDTTQQAALAAALGGGQSGVATHRAVDHRLGYSETTKRAEAELDRVSTPNVQIVYDHAPIPVENTRDGLYEIRPGRTVSVNISAPVRLTGTFRIRSVTLTLHSRRSNAVPLFLRRVRADLVVQDSAEDLGVLEKALAA